MIDELKGMLFSTVVGSFPYKVDRGLMQSPEWKENAQIRRTSWEALKFQLNCGIDFPSDGQFFDMLGMYLEPMKQTGFLGEDRTFGKGSPPEEHPVTSLEAELEAEARKQGASGIRVPITGPFTLAYRVKSGGESLVEAGDREGVLKLARAVTLYCRGFDRSLNNSILSVDEPVLPFVLPLFGAEFIQDVLNSVFKEVNGNYRCMHVCGEIKEIKDLLLSLDVDILDHEFQGTDNSGVYSREDLETNNKMLSYGLINTNSRQVFADDEVLLESVEDVGASLEDACRIYGLENLLISPDCGFGGWKAVRLGEDEKWRLIEKKLCNMVSARNQQLMRQGS